MLASPLASVLKSFFHGYRSTQTNVYASSLNAQGTDRITKVIAAKCYLLPLLKLVTNHLCCLMSAILYRADGESARIFLINDNDGLSSFFHGVNDMYLPFFHATYSGQSAKASSQGSSRFQTGTS